MSSEVDFWTRYCSLCSKAKVSPLRSISRRLKGTELSCPVEIIRSEHWPLLLKALSVDTSLTKLQFVSNLYPAASQEKQSKKLFIYKSTFAGIIKRIISFCLSVIFFILVQYNKNICILYDIITLKE